MEIEELPVEIQEIVRDHLTRRRHTSLEQLVCEALRTLIETEQMFESQQERLQRKIDSGLEELERGEFRDGEQSDRT